MLPVPREVLKNIRDAVQEGSDPSAIYMALPDESFAALEAVVSIGKEIVSDPSWGVQSLDYWKAFNAAKNRLSEAPHIHRSRLASIIATGRYIDEALKAADDLYISFPSLSEYWSSSGAANKANAQYTFQQSERETEYYTAPNSGEQHFATYSYKSKVQPTAEQERVLEAARSSTYDGVIKTEAFAGTGKTTLCGFLGQELAEKSSIYLAFNKPMADQAKNKLGDLLQDCRTTDSLAYKIIKPWEVWGEERTKPMQKMPYTNIADTLGLPQYFGVYKKGILARQIHNAVLNYCYSADENLDIHHVPNMDWPDGGEEQVLSWAKNLWAAMSIQSSTLPIQPAQVMKYWDLIGGTIPHDLVLFDEAQDANGAFMSILRRSDCQRILIGDHHQQLYDWRGAVNAMARIEGNAYPLTQSWRFGPAIADYANRVLAHKTTPPGEQVKGNEGMTSKIQTYSAGNLPEWPITILARTNMCVFNQAVEVAENGHQLHIVGNVKELSWILLDALKLYRGDAALITHPMLLRFREWVDLIFEEEHTGDAELKRIRQTVEERHEVLEKQLELIQRHHISDYRRASHILSTTHRVKGREWDRVMLLDDFIDKQKLEDEMDPQLRDAELNVLYVAATRAVKELYIPRNLQF